MCLANFIKLIYDVPSRIIKHRFSVGEYSRITHHYTMASCLTSKQCRQFEGEVSTGRIVLYIHFEMGAYV